MPKGSPDPRAGRPDMAGYGISTADEGLLPWSWAVERLERTRNYWVATVRPDGAPHAAPVWGVWLDNAFYFSTSGTSRKARNLAKNARCVVTTDQANEALIVEGVARIVEDAALTARVLAVYNKKYDWEMTGDEGPFFAVSPHRVFAFTETPGVSFTDTATRWTFDR